MSLRDLVKQRIIKNIIQDAQSKMKKNKKYTVIVADDTTIKILHHCFRMHELNELDIGVVLNVKFSRERVKVSPIYFLSANYDSAKHMCADYANPKETRYAAPVHAYFNSKVPKRIIELIKTENIRKYMKTLSEIHCDFLVLEHRVFSLYGGPKSFNNLYVDKEHRSDELAHRAQQLVGLCLSLEEEPSIRYSSNSRNAKTLAELFNQQMTDTKQSLTNWKPNTQHQSVLFVLDRKDDPLTPFMHSLSFQAMVYDLLSDDIDTATDKIKGLQVDKDKDEARQMPDENDEVWLKYRHEFIGEVVQKLPTQFNEWQEQNAVVKMKKSGDDTTTKDLILAARDMPQYQKLVKQYTTNINMASKLMDIFKTSGLRDVVRLEQDMTTGINDDGKKIDRTKMQQAFSSVLMDPDKPESLKLRTFMMYVISQGGMKPEQRKTLLKQSGFSEETEDTIVNLGHLGVTLTSSRPGNPSGGCKNYWKQMTKMAKSRAETTDITRFTSYLEWVLTQHCSASLSDRDFEWISKPGGAGANQNRKVGNPKSYRKHAKKKEEALEHGKSNKTRYIVFVLGGVSYAEIKTCYEFASKNDVDVFVGSTLIYSPQQYLKCFKTEIGQQNEE
eukprot:228995_1